MIINTNTITLSDSGLTLAESIIASHTSEISNNNATTVKVRSQIGIFQNVEKMLESPTNSLKVEGFEKPKNVLEFDYPTNDTNVFRYFDEQIKAYLLKLYPTWDDNKLTITT